MPVWPGETGTGGGLASEADSFFQSPHMIYLSAFSVFVDVFGHIVRKEVSG